MSLRHLWGVNWVQDGYKTIFRDRWVNGRHHCKKELISVIDGANSEAKF